MFPFKNYLNTFVNTNKSLTSYLYGSRETEKVIRTVSSFIENIDKNQLHINTITQYCNSEN